MLDVITFGSATKDIFLKTEESVLVDSPHFSSGKGVCFSLGSKVKVDDIYFTSGGGGTNTAVSFAKQGLTVAYCGKVGADSVGKSIIESLDEYGVGTEFVATTTILSTNHSVVIDVPRVDRTIFVYRGASEMHSSEDVNLKDLSAKWFYLAPFSAVNEDFFCQLIAYGKDNNTKIMANPGKKQLSSNLTREYLKKVDILLLNSEEASLLTDTPVDNLALIITKLAKTIPGINLVTFGIKGVIAHHNGTFFYAKPTLPDAIDRTGAGDSFGAGFLSKIIQGGSITEGIQLGVANSTSCLQKRGAKHGLLKKGDYYDKVPVLESKSLTETLKNVQ